MAYISVYVSHVLATVRVLTDVKAPPLRRDTAAATDAVPVGARFSALLVSFDREAAALSKRLVLVPDRARLELAVGLFPEIRRPPIAVRILGNLHREPEIQEGSFVEVGSVYVPRIRDVQNRLFGLLEIVLEIRDRIPASTAESLSSF
jgi:hypothetical protein